MQRATLESSRPRPMPQDLDQVLHVLPRQIAHLLRGSYAQLEKALL